MSYTNKIPTLCLNMIVKNEGKIITRLLDTVAELIDSYCICDTGSTDNTIDIIQQYFAKKNIPGKIVVEPFKDFGYNRTFALKECESIDPQIIGKDDYILLLDADMIFWLNPKITVEQFKQNLNLDSYNIFQGNDSFFYKNTRIVKNRCGFSYWGVTHEYVQLPKDAKSLNLDRDICFIKDIGDGGCKTDKFLRDINLLLKGLEDVPNNDRYTFYLANSYRDSRQYELAIETFKKRIKLGGWIEEIWYSYYNIGKCYKCINDIPNAVYYWLEAYAYYPNRIENLYELIQHYRIVGKNELAYTFYMLADYQRKKNTSWDYLFLQKDIYDYKIDYEMSIFGYYCNRDNHDLIKTCMKVLSYPGSEDNICKNVLSNYKFYTKDLISLQNNSISKQNMNVLLNIGKSIIKDLMFVSSTPSICLKSDGNLLICLRYVNYRINQEGKYINENYIETKNIIAQINIQNSEWKIDNEYELGYDKTHDNKYVGLEDVRLINMYNQCDGSNSIIYCANRGLNNGNNIVVEQGIIDEFKLSTNCPCNFLKYSNQNRVEKNWSIFESNNHNVKCIYKWWPLTIGTIDNDSNFIQTHEIKTPNFFQYLRGSTPGIIIGNELWFINHIVSYEDRRYYYHIIVVLDLKTYELKTYTPLWTFEKSKVEYTLGFVYMQLTNQFMIGYSIMDCETKYMMINKQVFDDMMIQHK